MKNMRKWGLWVGSVMLLGLWPAPAAGKASHFVRRVENVEAIVTRVLLSDAAGDADVNLELRPVPGKENAFLPHFWNPWHELGAKWIGRIAERFPKNPADYSDQCRQCAGLGPDGVGCKIEPGVFYDHHPCPKLFSCDYCLYDIERIGKIGMNALGSEAEIFFGSGSDDLNSTLLDAIRPLGMAACSGDGDFCCKELEWNQGAKAWERIAPPWSICGKRILISGVVSYEHRSDHDWKPEIHPVSTLIVDRSDRAPGSYTLAAFIDGSHPPTPGCPWWRWIIDSFGCAVIQDTRAIQSEWMFEYRTGLSEDWYPSNPEVDLTGLHPPRPSDDYGNLFQGGQDAVEPFCLLDPLLSFNVVAVAEHGAPAPGRCGKVKVTMDRKDGRGAAWVADLRAGWKIRHYGLDLSAKLETPGGILSPTLPGSVVRVSAPVTPDPVRVALPSRRARVSAPATPDPVGVAVPRREAVTRLDRVGLAQAAVQNWVSQAFLSAAAPDPACELTFRESPGQAPPQGLRRWYRWSVQAKADLPPGQKPAWVTQVTPSDVQVLPDLSQQGPQSLFSFEVWMPVPSFGQAPAYWESYTGELHASLKAKGVPVAWDHESFRAPRPEVLLGTTQPTIAIGPGGPVYATSLTATARRFCGDHSRWLYQWKKDGVALPAVPGPGPVPVKLGQGDKQTYEVTVSDPWGVEVAQAARVIMAPTFLAHLERTCSDGSQAVKGSPVKAAVGGQALDPAMLARRTATGPPPAKAGGSALCGDLRLVARAADTGGVGAKFPPADLGEVRFKWTDLWYFADSSTKGWQAIPAGWRKKVREAPGREVLAITPPPQVGFFQFQAAVAATDRWGRTASAQLTGTNDFSPPSLLPQKLQAIWKMLRLRQPMPTPDPCGGGCGGMGVRDRLTDAFATLLSLALLPTSASLTNELLALQRFALAQTDQGRRLAAALDRRPAFSVAATDKPWPKMIQMRAREAALRRLRADAAYQRRFLEAERLRPAQRGRERAPALEGQRLREVLRPLQGPPASQPRRVR